MKDLSLKDESNLFKELKNIYEQRGINKESFFECINVARAYEREERWYLLYRLKHMNGDAIGNDISRDIVTIANILLNSERKYGFYIAVIEASLEQ